MNIPDHISPKHPSHRIPRGQRHDLLHALLSLKLLFQLLIALISGPFILIGSMDSAADRVSEPSHFTRRVLRHRLSELLREIWSLQYTLFLLPPAVTSSP